MQDLFKDLDLSEEAKKTLAERIEEAKTGWIEGARNDADFIAEIRSAEAGKFYNSIEKVLKRNLDVDPSGLDESITGLKKQEALLKMGIDALKKGKDKTNQELQDELLKVKAQLKEVEEEKIPQIVAETNQKHYARYISEGILRDSLDFNTTCKAEARTALVNAYLHQQQWKAEWDSETGQYKVITKDGLKPTRNDKPLSNKEVIEAALEDAGVLQKSNGVPTGVSGKTEPAVRPKGKLSANAEAMAARFANQR